MPSIADSHPMMLHDESMFRTINGERVLHRPLFASPLAFAEFARRSAEWAGTPHRPGVATPGVGVDCVRFVASMLDACYAEAAPGALGDADAQVPPYAQDAGIDEDDDRVLGGPTVRWFLERYPNAPRLSDPIGVIPERCITRHAAPGDVLVLRVGRGINHVAICGLSGGSVWHAMASSAGPGARGMVTMSSLGDAALARTVRAIYRPIAAASMMRF